MELFDWLATLCDEGIIPSISTVVFGIVAIILEITKNKLVKKLSQSNDENAELRKKVEALETTVEVMKEMGSNTNAMTSAIADMLHMAYNNSKLDPATKLQLQKIYDACPDAVSSESVSLGEVIATPPTQEQIDAIPIVEQKSYADIISEKYE